MIPFRVPFFLPWFYPSLTWRMGAGEKTIYLTFDDGPVPGPTEFVLDVLKESSIKATFFCIGDNIRKHPIIFKKILDENHQVGNHTFHHLNGWKTSLINYLNNTDLCEKEIQKHFPQNATSFLFRPPYGRIRKKQIGALRKYRIMMWDVLTHDYDQTLPSEKCLKNSIAATRNGSIVVFHDSLKAERNLRFVLPRFIAHFAELGYQFGTL